MWLITSPLAFDAAAHMVEEVANAGRAVPQAIVWSYVGNATVAFVVVSITMWSIPDVNAALNSSTGFAFIYALQQASPRWAQAITAIIVLIAFAGCTGCNAAASREMAAFARDRGLPASQWLAKVSKTPCYNSTSTITDAQLRLGRQAYPSTS